jgi:hypothetical protein
VARVGPRDDEVALEADAPRVACRTHGVTVAQVPWARHGAGTLVSWTEPRHVPALSGLLAALTHVPGIRLPQLHPPAATDRRRRPFTTAPL